MLSNSLIGAYVYPTQGLNVLRPHAATAAGGTTLTTRYLGPDAAIELFAAHTA